MNYTKANDIEERTEARSGMDLLTDSNKNEFPAPYTILVSSSEVHYTGLVPVRATKERCTHI